MQGGEKETAERDARLEDAAAIARLRRVWAPRWPTRFACIAIALGLVSAMASGALGFAPAPFALIVTQMMAGPAFMFGLGIESRRRSAASRLAERYGVADSQPFHPERPLVYFALFALVAASVSMGLLLWTAKIADEGMGVLDLIAAAIVGATWLALWPQPPPKQLLDRIAEAWSRAEDEGIRAA